MTFFIIDIIGRKYSAAAEFILFALSTGLVAVCKGRYVDLAQPRISEKSTIISFSQANRELRS